MMNSKNNRLRDLIQSYMDDKIGVDELNELKTYLRNTVNDEELDSVVNELWSEIDLAKPLSLESDLMYKRILGDERIQNGRSSVGAKKTSSKIIPLLLKHWFTRVASIVLFISALFFYFNSADKDLDKKTVSVQNNASADVLAGGNKAVLTLADGTTINLDISVSGEIAEEAGMKIIKMDEGEVFYEPVDGEKLTTGHHVISTPRGGQYKLILPDGTKVWLNSSSSLRFPIQFDAEERLVELSGEAYFEVASKADWETESGKGQSFVVKSNTQRVEVLGTHFNINAYEDEKLVKTTLFEGSVVVKKDGMGNNSSPGARVVLKPGQQAQFNRKTNEADFRVLTVDIEEAMAWRNGNFLFKNTPLVEIMNQLSRWYDVEIDKENIPNYSFNGFIPRDEPLSKVLDMLELTGDLEFEINNKQISILK